MSKNNIKEILEQIDRDEKHPLKNSKRILTEYDNERTRLQIKYGSWNEILDSSKDKDKK